MSEQTITKLLQIKQIVVSHRDGKKTWRLTALPEFQGFFDQLNEKMQIRIYSDLKDLRKRFTPGSFGVALYEFSDDCDEPYLAAIEWGVVGGLGKKPTMFETEG